MLDLTAIDTTWTLFLDRDGVINHEKKGDYIRNADEFIFYEDSVRALAALPLFFGKIFIVTNQKGIGKGLMTTYDLEHIHRHMLAAITGAGGRIDHIYFCADLSDDSPNRKPNAGMAFQAKADYPEVDLAKSIIVGNRTSDMHFGRNAGMHTVFLATTHPETVYPSPLIDLRFQSLADFVQVLSALKKS